MNNAIIVGTIQTLCSLNHIINRFRYCYRSLQAILECTTFDIFHDDIGDVILFPKVMYLQDIGVNQFCYSTCFLHKPFDEYWIACMIRWQYFDRKICLLAWLLRLERGRPTSSSNA